jgi:predicted permease
MNQSLGAFRFLLHLAPRDFARTHGRELLADFSDALASEANASSRAGYVRRALLNFVVTVILWERAAMFWRQLNYAFRSLVRTPAITAIVIITLALGIGANVAAFSIVSGILFHPLPYAEPDRMVAVWRTMAAADFTCTHCPQSLYTTFELESRNHTFDALAPYAPYAGVLSQAGTRQPVRGALVGTRFFEVVGVHALLGRTFGPPDESATAVSAALVSREFFESALHGDAGILGRTLALDNAPVRIIGVVPDHLLFPNFSFGVKENPAIYVSIQRQPGLNPNDHGLGLVGRLAPGVSPVAGQADLNRVVGLLAHEHPTGYTYKGTREGMSVVPLADDMLGPLRALLFPVLGAVFIVLFVACLNVANLLLARAIGRQSEMATRIAVGATRAHIGRQIAAESAGYTIPAVILGVVFAYYALNVYIALAPPGLHRVDEIKIDFPVLAYSVAIAVVTALLTSWLPIRLSTRARSSTASREGRSSLGRRTGVTRTALVILQIAFSFALIAGCGLLLRSVIAYTTTDLGFRSERVVDVFGSPIDGTRYAKRDRQLAFLSRLEAGFRAVPGVDGAAFGTTVPLAGNGGDRVIHLSGSNTTADADFDYIGTGYFAALGAPPVRGREFTTADRLDNRPVVVVNEEFVRRFARGTEIVGKQVTFALSKGDSMSIVGVVPDVRLRGVAQPLVPAMYAPIEQMPMSLAGAPASFLVRSDLPVASLRTSLRAVWHQIDPSDAIPVVSSVRERVFSEAAPTRAYTIILGALSLIAFALALSGTAGVVAYGVARRRNELALRMALGARGMTIVAMLLRGAVAMAGAGLVAGLLLSIASAHVLAPQLFGVEPFDPFTYIAVGTVLICATMAASLVPAFRAASIAVVSAMRYE